MKISVIGAGNTGKVMSVFLKLRGYDVKVYDRNSAKVNEIQKNGIQLTGAINALEYVPAYSDLGECIKDADIIIVMTTSAGHRDIANKLKNMLRRDQSIIIFNGNWGAYEFNDVLGEEIINRKNISIAETNAMTFIATYESDTCVRVKKIKESVGVSYLSGNETEAIKLFMESNFNKVEVFDNIIETSLNNSNPTIHVPIIAMNLASIDAGKDFLFYTDGATHLAIEYIEKIDKERLKVCNELGIQSKGILEIINSFWPDKKNNLYDAIHDNPSYKTAKGPKSVEHRYFSEDIPYGLVPIIIIAAQLNLNTPYLNDLIGYLGSCLNKNYLKECDLNMKLEKIREIIER